MGAIGELILILLYVAFSVGLPLAGLWLVVLVISNAWHAGE